MSLTGISSRGLNAEAFKASLRLHFSAVFRIGNGQFCIYCSVEFINGELIVHFEKVV